MEEKGMQEDELNAPFMTKNWSRAERLAALASFLPSFTEPGLTFGGWAGGTEQAGVIAMPWFEPSGEADRFVKVAYDYGFVRDFDWMEWRQTDEAIALRDDPSALSTASEGDLAMLITALVRSDRFCEGALEAAFDSGLLTRIVERARQLTILSGSDG